MLGVPTQEIKKGASKTAFVIPESLLVTEDVGTPYYANAHIHKSYLLSPPAAKGPGDPAGDDDLAALFASADANGDGQISELEALQQEGRIRALGVREDNALRSDAVRINATEPEHGAVR